MVIKKDGRREPFDRNKIERGVQRSVEKRPVSQMSVERLVNEIEDATAMMGKASNEITASAIGDLVLEKLNDIDKVAYIRFASVYRRFETIDEFVGEIQKLGGNRERE
jgi:transcriptional repressor NrdR